MRRHTLSAVLACLTFLITPVATGQTKNPPAPEGVQKALKGVKERGGLVMASDPYGDGAATLKYLDQGWGVLETVWYYHADQGSVLIPREVLVHLEQATSEQPILSPENMARFRFLTQRKTPNNPDALPIGFARHEDQIGFTCAACHTGQIVYKDTAIRIDGAPALVDIPGFFIAIRDAERATLADTKKLERFGRAVSSKNRRGGNLEEARRMLEESLAWFEIYIEANQSTTVEGFGRMDAVGRILNQVIAFTSDPKHCLEPNAPTSYPLLWDAPRHDFVQWIGFAKNAGPGSLGRNVGEVIGVFGRVDVKRYETQEEAKRGYPSTVQAHGLVSMEESLYGLKSPVWPEEILPVIDRNLAERGRTLYQENCVSCHALIDRNDPRRKVTAMVTGIQVIGTDSTSASNLVRARAPTGKLEGTLNEKGEKFGPEATVLELLANLVKGILTAQPTAAIRTLAYAKAHGLEETTKKGDHLRSATDGTLELMSYKARPLNGIWASSPYLHNGSVPTLYELLLPAAQRPKQFTVGRWEFEPKKVGYRSDGQIPWVYDTSVTGNSNQGHEAGTSLSDGDRWALVEYLKTL